ncbi:hypothetical protein BGX20_008841 [Mortierella sp. AD010]|nr:hypothetical protein BGX20_008841 [Mortierella sp. AD010]
MFHPTRGGTRGGQDQFKWEDVKEDKHRENYLGNSLHAAVGRWQKGRDITWYAKGGDKDKDPAVIQSNKKAEIQSIKDAEAEAMAEALGYKTKRRTETTVTEKELKTAISKGDSNTQEEIDEKLKESEKIEGLGFRNRTQRMYTQGSTDSSSRSIATKANAVPVIPLIPHRSASGVDKEKERPERSSKNQKDIGKDEPERRRRRYRSRSASPSRQIVAVDKKTIGCKELIEDIAAAVVVAAKEEDRKTDIMTTKPTEKSLDNLPRASSPIWSYLSAITLGLLSSSCCLIQLILNVFSIGCAGFSVLTPFRPIFGSISLALIAYTVYKYRLSTRTTITMAFALILILTPEMVAVHNQSALLRYTGNPNSIAPLQPLVNLFHKAPWSLDRTRQDLEDKTVAFDIKSGKQSTIAPLVKYEVGIEGMACEACASRLRQNFISQPGIENVKVFFAEKKMEIWSKFGPNSLMFSGEGIQNMVAEVDGKYSARIIAVDSSINYE